MKVQISGTKDVKNAEEKKLCKYLRRLKTMAKLKIAV